MAPNSKTVSCFAYRRWFPNECQITIKLKCLHQTLEQASVRPAVKYAVAQQTAQTLETGFQPLQGEWGVISVTDLEEKALLVRLTEVAFATGLPHGRRESDLQGRTMWRREGPWSPQHSPGGLARLPWHLCICQTQPTALQIPTLRMPPPQSTGQSAAPEQRSRA